MHKSGDSHCSHRIPVIVDVDVGSLPRIYLVCAAILENSFWNICVLNFWIIKIVLPCINIFQNYISKLAYVEEDDSLFFSKGSLPSQLLNVAEC